MYGLERRQPREPAEPTLEQLAVRPAFGEPQCQQSRWLTTSLARTEARSRLEAELRAIAVDLLGRGQPGELPDDCAEWIATTVEAAVTRVSDSSLAAMAETLDARLDDAPPGVARRIREAEARHDAGYF